MNFTVPRNCAAQAGEHLGHAHQDRDVAVVAAGVHHADFLAVPCASRAFDAKGTSTCSVTGRPSMSARSATAGRATPPLSRPTTPVCGDFRAHLVQPELAQVRGDDGRGAELAVAELGVLVQVAPPSQHAGFDGLRGGIDLFGKGAGDHVACGHRGTPCFWG